MSKTNVLSEKQDRVIVLVAQLGSVPINETTYPAAARRMVADGILMENDGRVSLSETGEHFARTIAALRAEQKARRQRDEEAGGLPPGPWKPVQQGSFTYLEDADGRRIATLLGPPDRRAAVAEWMSAHAPGAGS